MSPSQWNSFKEEFYLNLKLLESETGTLLPQSLLDKAWKWYRIAKPDTDWWLDVTPYYRVWHTLVGPLACPWHVYLTSLEQVAGHPVYTHEITRTNILNILRRYRQNESRPVSSQD